jgi:upstream activation factor subunit UAF30
LIFSLGSQDRRVLIARCRPRRKPLPRTELTIKLWEYIRKHELQDPKDKRSIRADEKLLAVFDGKKAVSMFEMTKLVNGHLI